VSQYIAIEHLSIYAQDTIIVEDLSLNLEQGETRLLYWVKPGQVKVC